MARILLGICSRSDWLDNRSGNLEASRNAGGYTDPTSVIKPVGSRNESQVGQSKAPRKRIEIMQHCYECNAAIPAGSGSRVRVRVGSSDSDSFSLSRHPRVRHTHRVQYGDRLLCDSCAKASGRLSFGAWAIIGFFSLIVLSMCNHSEKINVARTPAVTPPDRQVTRSTIATQAPSTAQSRTTPKPHTDLSEAQRDCMRKAAAENSDLAQCW